MDTPNFGRYQLREELGRGGMATVYLAEDPSFDRTVAIKVLPREFLHDPLFRARFEREAKTIARLEHNAIVPVYDYGEQDGQLYLVMRYMKGGSLAQRLERGPLATSETAEIIQRLAAALDKAHSHGIVHRDLKPGNILFDEDGKAYLADFGIARWAEATVNLTGGMMVGTPAYMSPEQVQGDREVDGRSDQYSLAIIVFEMLTGRKPYQADTPAKVMMQHILDPVPELEASSHGLPSGVEPALTRALAKKPEDRFDDTGEFATTLTSALSGGPAALEAPRTETVAAEAGDQPSPAESTVRKPAPLPVVPPATPAPTAAPAPQRKSPWLRLGIAVVILGGLCLVAGVSAAGLGYFASFGLPGFASPSPTASFTPAPPSPTAEALFTGDLAGLIPGPEYIPGGLPFDSAGSSSNAQVGEIYYQRELAPQMFASPEEIAARLDEIGRQTSYYAQFADPDGCSSPSGYTLAGVTLIQHRDNHAAQEHTDFARSLLSDFWSLAQPYTALGTNGDIQVTDDEQYCDYGVSIQFTTYNLLVGVYVYGAREKLDLDAIRQAADVLAQAVNYNIYIATGQ
ncbi:MAG: serine/threonine protein kinase [Chloroflexi bacterium]|nr:serine/threonine protein kinase [Chloroflexota bacterium]